MKVIIKEPGKDSHQIVINLSEALEKANRLLDQLASRSEIKISLSFTTGNGQEPSVKVNPEAMANAICSTIHGSDEE